MIVPEDTEPEGPSELADWRAAQSGMPLADFENEDGALEGEEVLS